MLLRFKVSNLYFLLYIGTLTSPLLSSGPLSDEFVDAAVDARIQADKEINTKIKERLDVNKIDSKELWKKDFKNTKFYKKFAEHEKEVKNKRCEGKCLEKKQKLESLKKKYEQLNNQHVTLEKKLTEENLVQLENAPIEVRGEKQW